MTDSRVINALKRHLFGEHNANIFAILNGAAIPGLLGVMAELGPEHVCLYRGELDQDVAEVAPYLIMLEPDVPFTNWTLESCWGANSSIFGTTAGTLMTLRIHFRRFIMVRDETGKALYFRFYDPRVMRAYLPRCEQCDLINFYGNILTFFVEDVDPKCAIQYSLEEGALRRKGITL